MASTSTLPGPALQAAKAALTAALAENQVKPTNGDATHDEEEGEIQEVDMQQQAENIRTVFNDPKNFNVKVCTHSGSIARKYDRKNLIGCRMVLASTVLTLDSLVRLACDQGSQSASDTDDLLPSDASPSDPWWVGWCGARLDGGHQACH